MTLSLEPTDLAAYLDRLTTTHLPDQLRSQPPTTSDLKSTLERVEYSFSRIKRKYYAENGHVHFNHLNTDHMASFLWIYSNEIWKNHEDTDLPTRLSYLNKILHGIDLFYFVPLPSIFFLVHPLGTIVGRGTFKDYLVIHQQCTVGDADGSGAFPSFGGAAVLYAGSTVLGDCQMGDNVAVGAGTLLINESVPDGTLVTGRYPNSKQSLLIPSVRHRFFN
jgi:serine O-acetyltransferase